MAGSDPRPAWSILANWVIAETGATGVSLWRLDSGSDEGTIELEFASGSSPAGAPVGNGHTLVPPSGVDAAVVAWSMADRGLDRRAREFLAARGAEAALVASVFRGGQGAGFVCIEQANPAGDWSADDRAVARLAADLASVAFEVFERARAEVHLKRRETQLRRLMELAPLLIVIRDDEGRIVYVNPTAAESFGKPAPQLVGQWFQQVLAVPAEAARMLADDREVLDADVPKYALEETFTDSTGAVRSLQTFKIPYEAASTRRRAVLCLGIDITSRVRAERSRQESEDLFRVVASRMPDGLFLLDSDPEATRVTIRYVNRAGCRAHGYSREELVGQPVSVLEDAESARWIPDRLRRALAGEVVVFEAMHRRKDSTLFPVEVTSRAILHGDRRAIVALGRDISQRKQAETERHEWEARQKLESLGLLAGGIAHDFNNLLVGILGNAGLALFDLPRSSPARSHIEDVETAARRAAELCQQLLAYSGRGRFVIEPVHLSTLVAEIVDLLGVSISKKAVLRRQLAADIPPVLADATQLRQVLMNLVTNASEAIGDRPGVITVATGVIHCDAETIERQSGGQDLAEGQYVVLEVTDTGGGMDDETLRRVFEPFYTTKFTGRGLGMAAVQGIVRGHRGMITIESKPNQGTKVRVLLPAAVEAAVAPASPAIAPVRRPAGGTVMVVDDEPMVRAVATRTLEKIGYSVLVARDGIDALNQLSHGTAVRAVLMDLTMPNMDGEEAYQLLKARRPDIKVILSSGYSEQEATHRFGGAELDGFLQKPWHPRELIALLGRVLG